MESLQSFLNTVRAQLGDAAVLTQPEQIQTYGEEPRCLWHHSAAAVLLPADTVQVSAVMRLATQHRVAIIPQGGNTGLVGGQVPSGDAAEVIVSLKKLNRLRQIDAVSNCMIVEAGMTLQAVQEAAAAVDRLFPLSLAAEGSCTIGGNLATNAGGINVIAYGNSRDLVLGVEAVLADGSILRGLNTLRKDNTGYDLKHLLMGSEGTLGLITAACLKLFPQPRARVTAFCGLASPQAALDLLQQVQNRASGLLTSFELMPRRALDFELQHLPDVTDPLAQAYPWYVLMEVAALQENDLEEKLGNVLAAALENNIAQDVVLASSEAQRKKLWRLREEISWVQKYEGGSIKHDVSVPVGAVPAFIAEANLAVEKLIAGCRPVPFGHMGDGNIHYNVSQPISADKENYLAQWQAMNEVVHGIVRKYGGSISAEHGIGQLKRDEMAMVKDPVALGMMRAIKAALDPHGILNPHKVL